eukprot:206188-Pelagomonas_calceolata.AAC.3
MAGILHLANHWWVIGCADLVAKNRVHAAANLACFPLPMQWTRKVPCIHTLLARCVKKPGTRWAPWVGSETATCI